jgi:predicted transcriptional regulator
MIIDSETMTARTAEIAAAFVANNATAISDVPRLITSIHDALSGLGQPAAPAAPEFVPAIDPKKSIKPDHLISLIDGRPYKMLRRHLAIHGLTPEEYIERYGLKKDYPMTAANYSARRRDLAKQIGLGTKGRGGGRKRKAA